MRPTIDAMLLAMAEVVATRSTCDRLHVGAVLALDGRPFAVGYNGAPRGLEHCSHTTDSPCTDSVHAEANAVANAALAGTSTRGADLFLTHEPCLACSGLIINAGVARVVYSAPFRSAAGRNRLAQAGVPCDRGADTPTG